MNARSFFFMPPALAVLLVLCAAPVSAGEARIAISVFQVNSSEDLGYLQAGLSSLLPPRISVPGKILVVDNTDVRRALSPPQADYSTEKKAQLAGTLKVDYLLTGSLTKIGDAVSIDAFLYDAASPELSTPLTVNCTGLDSMLEKVQELAVRLQRRIIYGTDPDAAAAPAPVAEYRPAEPAIAPARTAQQLQAAPAPVFQPAAPVFEAEPAREYVIMHTPFVSMAAGDVTGSGRLQLLLADNLDVRVYDPTPEELILKATVPAKTGEYIIHVDAFDLNDNGRAEIYVSSHTPRMANSFIAEYTEGSYPRIAENMPWLLRTYPSEDRLILLGIKPGTFSPFSGTAFEFIWKDGTAQPAAECSLPGGVSPFGSSRHDINGDLRDEYIAFSRGILNLNYSLHVMSATGRILWKDTQKIGGEPNSFPRSIVGDGAGTSEAIPLRTYCADINADGRTEILAPRNTKKSTGVLGRISSYDSGEMLCLHWDGTSLNQNWSSSAQDGYIADFLVADIDGDGAQELIVLAVARAGLSGRSRNTVSIYKQAR
ncbi:MAG: VCBS repeat-containing protein [Deltaproteobacteria bacterium]|nr:VCBS repeat-containing protein [Deltaproteobacteria bacterium]